MKATLVVYLLLLHLAAPAQNLLANGSFEDANICTEFLKDCAPEAWISTSLINNYYFEGIQQAYDGVHFCGVITGSVWERNKKNHSFLCSRLLCRLRKGNHYHIEFRAWSKHTVFDSLGIYFSAGDFLFEKQPYWQLTPALLVHDSAGELAAPQGWQTCSFDYTATGEENYFVLGSFKRSIVPLSQSDDAAGNFYLYVDRVSMMATDPHELMCKSADSMKTIIYDQNERHNLLEKKRAIYRNAPPPVTKAPPTIEQHIDTLLIPDILFATGSAKLTEGSHHVLDSFCMALGARPSDSLVIEGHTDSVGSLQYNFRLSANRAAAVAQYLRLKTDGGMPPTIVRYHAFLKPLTSNSTLEGRMRNRRVELFLYRHD